MQEKRKPPLADAILSWIPASAGMTERMRHLAKVLRNMRKKVPDTNGGALRVRLANPYQGILYFSLKTMFRVLKLHGVLLKAPPFVPDT